MPVGECPIGWALGVLVPSMGRSLPIDIDEIGEQLPSLERRAGWRDIGSFGEGVISRPSSALGKWGKRKKKKAGSGLPYTVQFVRTTFQGSWVLHFLGLQLQLPLRPRNCLPACCGRFD